MIVWPLFVGGLAVIACGVALAWKSHDLSGWARSEIRRAPFGWGWYGELLYQQQSPNMIRLVGFGWCAMGAVAIVLSLVAR